MPLSGLQLSASAQAGLGPTDPCIVNFYVAPQGLAHHVDHRPPEFVQHHPCGLVTRRRASWRCKSNAEMPRLSVVIKYAAQNQTVSGVFVLCRTVPAVTDT